MTALVPISGAQAPALAQQKLATDQALVKNFSDGVIDSYPVISIKGKIFRFKFQGEEKPHIDANRYPIPYLDVVLVNASPNLSKVYYEKGFTEGDMNPPDCWSLNGIRPDPSSPKLQAPACAGCKQNVFGSKVTPSGKQAKACADSRRVAVAFPASIDGGSAQPVLLRIPQSSTKGLREYVQFLARNNFLPNACITRLSFDTKEAFPKVEFTFAGPLTDAQYGVVDALVGDDRTKRILDAPIDGPASEELDGSEPGTMQTRRPDPVTPQQYAAVGQPAAQPAAQPAQAAPAAPAVDPMAAFTAPAQAAPAAVAEPVTQQVTATPQAPPAVDPMAAALAAMSPEQRALVEAAMKGAAQVTAPTVTPPAPTISEQAAPTGPAHPGPTSAPGAGLTPVKPAALDPFAALAANPMPEGTPAFLAGDRAVSGPVIDGTINPAEPKPEPKKRTRAAAPPTDGAAAPAAAAGAPASLDALLAGLLK